VVYPMNALANSQDEELGKFLKQGYPEGKPPVRFARYTGQEKGPERDATLQVQAHERVREATRHRAKVRIEPVLPVDILGAYLLLPVLPG